jgi:N-acetylglucosaminyl-diphospho-decaprenol L-rhamnosyltransferase
MSDASHDVLVSTVVVGYENPEDVERCLHSIAAVDPALLEDLTLVDHSATERCRTVADRFDVQYVPSPNRGFGAGANVGARLSRGRFLFFLNPDAELRSALTPVVAAVGGRNGAWAGVALLTDAGQTHADAYRLWFFSVQRALDRLLVRLRLRKPPAGRPLQKLCGGAMVVPRDVFRDVGGFDEAFFLYGEDADLTLRLAEQAVELVLLRDVFVEHRAGSSGRRTPVPIQAHQGFSAIYLVGKHKGHLWAVLALAEMVVVSIAGAVGWALVHREDRRGGLARMARITGGARALAALWSG